MFLCQEEGGFYTYGEALLETSYSKTLVDLLHKCLAYDPDRRPRAAEILEVCSQTLALYDELRLNPGEAANNDLAGKAQNELPPCYTMNAGMMEQQRVKMEKLPPAEAASATGNDGEQSERDLLFPTSRRTQTPDPESWWE
jgi:serine/threonine protein kinase